MIVIIVVQFLEQGAPRLFDADIQFHARVLRAAQPDVPDPVQAGTEPFDGSLAIIDDDELRGPIGLTEKATERLREEIGTVTGR